MAFNTKPVSVLNYWRNCIADGNRMSIDSYRLANSYTLKNFNLEPGQIPQEAAEYLFQLYLKQFNRYNVKKITIEDLKTARILISPFYIIPIVEHGEQRKNRNPMPVFPLWIPAIIDKEGKLSPPDNNTKPWMNRLLLEPVNTQRVSVILSSVEKVDEFLTHNEAPKDRWQEYWIYCRKFFAEVTGKNWDDIKANNFVSANYNKILLDTESSLVTSAILNLYDFLRDEKTQPALFSRFSSTEGPPLKTTYTENDIISKSPKHYGHMDPRYSLAPSQRLALYHLLDLEDGEILAINGPPGTGKTTLLQNVIADLFVGNALKGGDPPILVASSNNNQAIINILDVFGESYTKDGSLKGRWLPEIVSYGLYLPSKNAKTVRDDIPTTTPFGDGFPKSIENKRYYLSAKSYFLDKFSEYSGTQTLDIKSTVEWLHKELTNNCNQLRVGHYFWKQKYLLRRKIQRFDKLGGIDNYRLKLNEKYEEKVALNDNAKKIRTLLLENEQNESIWYKIFSFLNVVRKKRAAKYQLIFSDFPSEVSDVDWFDITTIYQYLKRIIEESTASIDKLKKRSHLLSSLIHKNEEAQQNWYSWKNQHNLETDPPKQIDELDTTVRHVAFQLASHYWEGRWLLECEKLLFHYEKEHSQKKHENKWRRYAMVTPCFVTTFFMLPKFFSYPIKSDDGIGYTMLPHLEFIDLLIVDEAGQVAPEIGGASFAMAKKSIVLGDVYQIEPVWRISPSVDSGNLEVSGIIGDRKDQDAIKNIDDTGITASRGSVMKAACLNTSYRIKGQDVRGLLLTEHRRCFPEIISFCNELVYKGSLKPLRKQDDKTLLPNFGYAQVNGASRFVGGSRVNIQEAKIIATWLKKNKATIEEQYNNQLYKAVGIITPFAAQARQLKQEILSTGIKISKFKIGTVHTLQGAERALIIFSPVYSINDRGSRYFFDQGPNMLNVAVSRAKDSFLVFGEMSLFDPNATTPSGLLAHYLFKSEANEILDIPHPPRSKTNLQKRISTLEDHRKILCQVLEQASENVLIVSPFISISAISADNLVHKIKKAIERGVKVTVYTDAFLDMRGIKLKKSSEQGRNALKEAGAELIILNGIHNKTLIRDNDLLIEGSFNWLSAVRNSSSPFRRHEVSSCYEGKEVSKFIHSAILEMKNLDTIKEH